VWHIFYVYVNNKNQVKRKVTMYSNNDVEGKKNNYDQKLLYKGHFNGNNEVIKYEPYNYGIYTHKSSFKRFIGNLLGKV
jgi:hypothetical protein